MKAYVIKNKEGKYLGCCQDFETNNICDARPFTYGEAVRFCPKNCEVVEITIAEGDLEQEVEELKTSIDYWKNEVFKKIEVKLIGVTKEKIQEIRKQVCDEIRDFMATYNASDPVELFVDDLLRKLDRIEKGEEE